MQSIPSTQQETYLIITNSILVLKLKESKFSPTVTKAIMPDIPKNCTREKKKMNKISYIQIRSLRHFILSEGLVGISLQMASRGRPNPIEQDRPAFSVKIISL